MDQNQYLNAPTSDAEINAFLANGCRILGCDGTDVVLQGDGWYFEHFRIPNEGPMQIITSAGPYHAVGVPRMIERSYREQWERE